MSKFQLRDRVRRRVNVFDSKSPYRYGRVALIARDPWGEDVYTVEWDDGNFGVGYFAHGLEPAVERCTGESHV